MKPFKTLLILLVFLVFLFGPSFFLDGPVRITSGLSIKFPELPEKISALMVDQDNPSAVDSIPSSKEFNVDSLSVASNLVYIDSTMVIGHDIEPIQFADSSVIFRSLVDSIINGKGQVRIMYYGDSQLEGDRITDWMRKELRTYSGGTGPGLLSPTMLVPYTRSSNIRTSSNWKKYNFLSYHSGEIKHRALGPMLSISRFTLPTDTVREIQQAWIKITPSMYADSLAKIYDRVRIMYGNLDNPLLITISGKGEVICNETLQPVKGAKEFVADINRPGEITINMAGISSPDIYGISIESADGIIVDNIASRGSAGLEFSLVDPSSLNRTWEMLNPDLLILHYGLNVVRGEKDNYLYYENAMYRQLEAIRKILPQTAVIVVGVTDMAKKLGDEMHSYPNIPLITEAQRNAASRAGVLFWDSREAMGGEDAIVEWKNSDPPLAAEDYTHLSYEGGNLLAEKLLESILAMGMPQNPTATGSLLSEDNDSEQVIKLPNEPSAARDSVSQGREVNSGFNILHEIGVYDPENPLIFTGFAFWLFFLVLLLGYSLIFSKPVLRNGYLFLFSLFFYYKSGGLFFMLLVISTLTDYLAAWIIYSVKRKSLKRLFVVASLAVNLGMLGYFKYAAFLTGVVNDLLGTSFPVYDWLAMLSNRQLGTAFDVSQIILPVGISFFTFQTISYTMDVYRGKIRPVRNIMDFGFYVSFFPQLVAGPIVRASEFIPQLYTKFSLTSREWGHALFLILSGLVKKIIVSDYISVNLVDRVFSNPEMYSGFENLLSVYGYGLQIYCDFSGYTDIAIGVALMLGYRLPVNFNSPYKAGSITDFWRRWHISLSRWLRDYLYISMGGNRKGRFRTNFNLIVTMLLGGLWHGAAWRFVIWGGLHGIGLVIHKIWIRIFRGRGDNSKVWMFISVFITFNFVSFCWVFFRAGNIAEVKTLLHQIAWYFSPGEWSAVISAYSQVLTVIIAGYIIHFLPVSIKEAYRGLFIKMPLLVKMLSVYLLALAIYNIQSADMLPFIYFRF